MSIFSSSLPSNSRVALGDATVTARVGAARAAFPVVVLIRRLGCGLACILGGTAAAQDPAAPPAAASVVLPELVVAATRVARPLAEVPFSVTVLSRAEVLAVPGRSIEETLRGLAGVQLPADNSAVAFPLNPSLSMRGLGLGDTATRALVLVDGIPLNGGFFGHPLWNRVGKADLARVEIVRGASSSLFGSFAMGGVVSMVTQVPVARTTRVEVQGGEDGLRSAALRQTEVVGERFALSFSGDHHETDGFYRVAPAARRPVDRRTAAELTKGQGRIDFQGGEVARGFLKVGHNRQERAGGFAAQTTEVEVSDVAAGVEFDLEGAGRVEGKVFYVDEDYWVDNVRVTGPATTFVSNRHRTSAEDVGAAAQWSHEVEGGARWLGALDYRRVVGRNFQEVFNRANEPAAEILGGGAQTAWGAVAEVGWTPAARWDLVGSIRADRFRDTRGRLVTNGVEVAMPRRTVWSLSPRLAARVGLGAGLDLRAAYAEGFRAPTLAERYRSFESPTFRGLSNPTLTQERSQGGEFGLAWRAGRLTGQVNAFHQVLRDFVGTSEVGFTAGKFTVRADNVARIRSEGVEVIVRYRVAGRFELGLDYALTDAEVTRGPLSGNRVEGAPRNVLGASLAYRPEVGLRFDARVRAVGRSYQDITNEAPQDGHFIADLKLTYPVGSRVEVFAVANNLLDEQYIADGLGGSLGAPRQISGGIRLEF